MELVGGDEEGAGAFEELQADGPVAALPEVLVQQLEQGAGPRLLAGADEGAGDADEVVEVRGVFFEARQPFALDGLEIALRQLTLCGSRRLS